jgi:hypothetical protein
VFGSTLESVSVIVPEIVTGTIWPFGGHRVLGVAETVITGGVTSSACPTVNVVGAPMARRYCSLKFLTFNWSYGSEYDRNGYALHYISVPFILTPEYHFTTGAVKLRRLRAER